MSANVGTQMRSRPDGATNPRAMATALIAWFSAPAPTTCTSTTPSWRSTPARAPAQAFGLLLLETLRTSTCGPSRLAALLDVENHRALRRDSTARSSAPALDRCQIGGTGSGHCPDWKTSPAHVA